MITLAAYWGAFIVAVLVVVFGVTLLALIIVDLLTDTFEAIFKLLKNGDRSTPLAADPRRALT
jgi:hypothetical protein